MHECPLSLLLHMPTPAKAPASYQHPPTLYPLPLGSQVKPNPKNAKEVAVAVAHEGERVLKAISPSDQVVLLDERGRDLSSTDLAKLLAQASDRGWTQLVFCIGAESSVECTGKRGWGGVVDTCVHCAEPCLLLVSTCWCSSLLCCSWQVGAVLVPTATARLPQHCQWPAG